MNKKSNHTPNAALPQLSLFPEVKETQANDNNDVLFEYFFIIAPPETTKHKIKSLKQTLHKAVPLNTYNLNNVSPVSIMSFNSFSPVNSHFIDVMTDLFSKMPGFNLAFNGFDQFTHGTVSNTIYAKLKDATALTLIYNKLHALLGLKPRAFTPHLTIARTIPRTNYNKSIKVISKQPFQEEFTCDKVTILERKIYHGLVSKYRVLTDIKLMAA